MPEAKKATAEEVMEAVTTLREEVQKSIPNQEKLEKINSFLDGQEKFGQDILAEQKKAQQDSLDLKERIDTLESELARKSQQVLGENYRESPEYKALEQYIKFDHKGMSVDDIKSLREQKTLRTDIDTQGGFMVPTELDNVITKKIVEVSDIRSIARVRSMAGKNLEIPIRNNIPIAQYEGEGETGNDSESDYENTTITPFRQTFTTPITQDQLMDAAFNMEGEITSDAAEAFAFGEGNNFVSGTGVKQPAGFLTNAQVVANARDSESVGTLTADDILLLTGDLKVGYNPNYVLNRRTLAFIRTLKSTTGSFLWQPGLNGVVANSLAGFPYLIANAMPDIANDAKPIAFGDFMRGYLIVDRTGMTIIRDEFSRKKQAIIEFTMNRWNTGQVVLSEAIKILNIKSS